LDVTNEKLIGWNFDKQIDIFIYLPDTS